jgi:hypothetical protein
MNNVFKIAFVMMLSLSVSMISCELENVEPDDEDLNDSTEQDDNTNDNTDDDDNNNDNDDEQVANPYYECHPIKWGDTEIKWDGDKLIEYGSKTYTYNSDDQMIKYRSTSSMEESTYEYEYKADGTLKKMKHTYGYVEKMYAFEYSGGKLTGYTLTDEYGQDTEHEVETNSDGQMTKNSELDTDGNVVSYTAYEYDANGNVSKSSLYENGELKSKAVYAYDDKHSIHKVVNNTPSPFPSYVRCPNNYTRMTTTSYLADGSVGNENTMEWNYGYNDRGQVTKFSNEYSETEMTYECD